jgi:hypothetical protein
MEEVSGGIQFDVTDVTLPTRCLDVTDNRVRLVETNQDRGPYIILSHRWTPTTTWNCRTTPDNYSDRLKGIDLKQLTKTFNDSIKITRELGFKYLWIDSICIIQKGDDGIESKDWKTEALRMADYYQHAVFTIFAVVPEDNQGILRKRELPFRQLVRLPYRDTNGTPQGHFYVLDSSTDWDTQFKERVRANPLLAERGWIFQEWFLSRRIIYFTPSGLFFECVEKLPMTEGYEEITYNPREKSKALEPYFKASIRKFNGSTESLWYSLVEIYSQLQLTFDEDRIKAIAGIAKVVRDMFMQTDDSQSKPTKRYEYVSGLWLRDIHHGLLWQKRNGEQSGEPWESLARPPSWSWASLKSAVCWNKKPPSTKPAMTVVALVTNDEKGNLTVYSLQGSTESGVALLGMGSDGPKVYIGPFDIDNVFTCLRVVGHITPVLIRQPLADDQYNFMRKATDSFAPDLWTRDNTLNEPNLVWFQICSPSEHSIIGGWAAIEQPHIIDELRRKSYLGPALFALHVSTRRVSGGLEFGSLGHSHDAYNVLFLENKSGNQYRRVGMGCIFEKNIIERFKEAAEEELDLI